MLTLLLMFAFSVNCLAWVSPTQTAVPTKEKGTGNGGGGGSADNKGDHSKTSPKTGMAVAGAFVVIITASGVALVARKKFAEE